MPAQARPGLLFPPVGRRPQSVADQKRASLRFQLLAMMHQLSTLTAHMPRLLFFFARYPDQRQLPSVALHLARQTLTQRRRVARIGLHPAVLCIEFAWSNHITVGSGCNQLSVETEPKAARFINHMHAVAPTKQCLH